MLKIGLTGGIASGKSGVAKWFVDKGITVFDSDKSVHEQFTKPSVISLIKNAFGEKYIDNGVVNRALLGNTVFNDLKVKKKLEEILHPLVFEEMNKQYIKSEMRKEKVVIMDIPLLFEVSWEKYFDEVWVVYVPIDMQIQRLMSRSSLTMEDCKKRIFSQISLEEKILKADRVIDNSGSWLETEKQLLMILKELEQ